MNTRFDPSFLRTFAANDFRLHLFSTGFLEEQFLILYGDLNRISDNKPLPDVTGMASDPSTPRGVDDVSYLDGEDCPPKTRSLAEAFVFGNIDKFARLEVVGFRAHNPGQHQNQHYGK